jgi:hypothetical protein
MTRLWAKREEQINGVVDTMAGLYGDLQGIAGRSLQEIEGLQVPLLDGRRQMRLLSKKHERLEMVRDRLLRYYLHRNQARRRSSSGGNEGTTARACLCRSSRGTANDHR